MPLRSVFATQRTQHFVLRKTVETPFGFWVFFFLCERCHVCDRSLLHLSLSFSLSMPFVKVRLCGNPISIASVRQRTRHRSRPRCLASISLAATTTCTCGASTREANFACSRATRTSIFCRDCPLRLIAASSMSPCAARPASSRRSISMLTIGSSFASTTPTAASVAHAPRVATITPPGQCHISTTPSSLSAFRGIRRHPRSPISTLPSTAI